MRRLIILILVSVSFVSMYAEDADCIVSVYADMVVDADVDDTSLAQLEVDERMPLDSAKADFLTYEWVDVMGEEKRVPRFISSVGGGAGLNQMLKRGSKALKTTLGSNYGVFYDWQANPYDSLVSVYDYAFGFPTLEAGVQLLDYSRIRMQQESTPYMSTLGYIWAAYVGFRRDIYRNRRWAFSYSIENGLSLSSRTYEASNNVDNDYIGQHISMFFDFGLYAAYRIAPAVEVGLGFEFKHVSNAATDRPNKGTNNYGLTMRAKCDLNRPAEDRGMTYAQRLQRLRAVNTPLFEPYLYLDVNAAVGFRTLYEEWVLRCRYLPEDDPLYRDGKLGLHTVWYAGIVPMFRYNRVHASGIGLEYAFGGYTSRSAKIERQFGLDNVYSYSKHVLTISAHHEVFYKNLSMAMSLGTYLYRQHGWVQRNYEPPIIETIGIRYYPSFFKPFYIGYSVKANLDKAYDMEVKVGIHAGHWGLKKKR